MGNIFIEYTNEIAIITLNNIPNDMFYISNIFNIISEHNINIDMISKTSLYKSEISLIFSTNEKDLHCLLDALEDIKNTIPGIVTEITGNYTKITATNIYKDSRCDLISHIFKSANKLNIDIFSICLAENEISVFVSSEYSLKFTEELKNIFK